jgi:hypothetical protein
MMRNAWAMRSPYAVTGLALSLAALLGHASSALSYPPAVGILGKSRSCTICHASNGPWQDESRTIVDILDAATRRSLRQPDGSFRLQVERGRPATLLTVIGRTERDTVPPPTRNAWLYVDPTQLETGSLSKFAPGWDVNLPMACRIVGDSVPEYPGAAVTALPMTVRAGDAARDAEIELQILLTSGGPGKGDPDEWLRATYLERRLTLKVVDP